MKLQILSTAADQQHIALQGRLDSAGVDAVETQFNAAVVARRKPVIVDLTQVEFLSSMGVRMLLSAAKALQRAGVRMVLVASGQVVTTALTHSAIDELIPVAADVDGARALLSNSKP